MRDKAIIDAALKAIEDGTPLLHIQTEKGLPSGMFITNLDKFSGSKKTTDTIGIIMSEGKTAYPNGGEGSFGYGRSEMLEHLKHGVNLYDMKVGALKETKENKEV